MPMILPRSAVRDAGGPIPNRSSSKAKQQASAEEAFTDLHSGQSVAAACGQSGNLAGELSDDLHACARADA